MNQSWAQSSSFHDEGVKLISCCPFCDTNYDPRETRVLGEREDSHLLHIQCRRCSNAIIALVLISAAGVSSVGLATDLDSDEVGHFREAAAITTDDVIETHSLLQNEDELFRRLALA